MSVDPAARGDAPAVPGQGRCGVLLPTADLTPAGRRALLDAARAAQQLGFAAAWAADDLGAAAPGLDALSALAAAAAVTDTIALGPDALRLDARVPAWAAKQLQAIDQLAGPGRLRVGVAAEPADVGDATTDPTDPCDPHGARLDDALTVLPALLAGDPVEHAGEALEVHCGALTPGCDPPPAIYVAGAGAAALRRAARAGDAWLATGLSPAAVAERAATLGELALEHDRPAPRTALRIAIRIDDDAAHARAVADAHLRARPEPAVLLDSIDGAVERLGAYRAVGVDEILLVTLGPDTLAQYERLADLDARLDAAGALR